MNIPNILNQSRLLAKAFHNSLTRMRTQVVHHQVDGIGPWVTGGDVQKVIRKLGRRAAGRYVTLVKCRPAFDATRQNTLAVPQCLYSMNVSD